MFTRLADFITKRYVLVIIAWIVVLFYVFPLIFSINDVVVYTESETGLEGLEAMNAQEIIDRNFAGQIPPSTIMIVIQNDDVLTPEVRDFASGLYSDIATGGTVQGVISVNYLYSAVEAYITQTSYQTAPAAHMLYDQVNGTAQMVYGIPVFIAQTHSYLEALYAGTLDDPTIRAMVMTQLQQNLAASGLDAANMSISLGYAEAFYPTWLDSKTLDPAALRVQISAVSGLYFAPKGQLGEFAMMVQQALTVETFTSSVALQQLTLATLSYESGLELEFLAQIWALGPAPTLAEAGALAHSVVFGTAATFDTMPKMPDYLVSQFVNVHPESGTPNNTMLMVISLSVDSSSPEAEADVRALREITRANMDDIGPGYSVYVSGDSALNVDMMDAVNEDINKIDIVTILLILLLVGAYFRSVATPWIPLMTVGMAFLVATAFIYLLGTYVMSIHYSVLIVMLVVMLGAGADYCIFIMSRYREERVLGRPKEEAVRTSLTWAGESIATSGAAVMIGFGALMIGDYSLVRSMGMALVIAIGIALLFALTMLPSLLMLVGDRVFWPHTMEQEAERHRKRKARGGGYFAKSARFALKNRKAIVIVAVAIAIPAAYLSLTMESSYDFIAGLPEAESKMGLDALGSGFGEGKILPTYIVVQYEEDVFVNGTLNQLAATQLEAYSELVEDIPNVRSITGPTRPFGTPVSASYLAGLPADDRATYEMVALSAIGSDNRTILLTVVLQEEPFTTTSIQTIYDIRTVSAEAEVFAGDAIVLVGGPTASMGDVSESVDADFATMRYVVIIGIFLVLLVVLGSVLIPVRLIATVLLNVTWTVAATMIVFEFVKGVPVLWMMPIILFVIAMGLGMDYDIFLTTRIREEVTKGKSDEKAILTAVEQTGGIITACGLIMGGAFGSMMLSSTALLQEFGFGLCFVILIDAMLVRIYLVPAIMLLLQKWNWYAPGRLQRVNREQKARKD